MRPPLPFSRVLLSPLQFSMGLALVFGCKSADPQIEQLEHGAVVAESQGDWVDAGDLWQRTYLAGGRQDPAAVRGLARALVAQGEHDAALAVLEGARREGHEDARLLADLATLLVERDSGLSIETYRAAGAADPSWAEPLREAGALALAEGRTEDARIELGAAVVRDPTDAEAQRLLAHARAALGEPAAAVVAWDASFANGGYDAGEAILMGRAARSASFVLEPALLERASSWLERACEEDPQSGAARMLLAELLIARGQSERAIDPLRRAVELDPGDLHALQLLAQGCAELGQLEELERVVAHARAVAGEGPERAPFDELLARAQSETENEGASDEE